MAWGDMALLIDRNSNFAVGSYEIVAGSNDSYTVTVTNESRDGFRGGWGGRERSVGTGRLQLDEVGAAGGGVLRGSFTGTWTQMVPLTNGAQSGSFVERAGSVTLTFRATRP